MAGTDARLGHPHRTGYLGPRWLDFDRDVGRSQDEILLGVRHREPPVGLGPDTRAHTRGVYQGAALDLQSAVSGLETTAVFDTIETPCHCLEGQVLDLETDEGYLEAAAGYPGGAIESRLSEGPPELEIRLQIAGQLGDVRNQVR